MGKPLRSCDVKVRTGRGHIAIVSVSTEVLRVEGKPRAGGSLIDVFYG